MHPTEPTPEEQPRRNYEAEALRDIAMADAGDTEALERVRGNMRYNKFLDERSTRDPETRASALGEMLCASQGLALPLMIKKLDEAKRPSACIGCRSCENVCPQQIKISGALKEFSADLAK